VTHLSQHEFTCTHSEFLGLNELKLDGTIPTEIGLLSNLGKQSTLHQVKVSRVALTINYLAVFTAALDLYDTEVTGQVPTELGRLTNLGKSYEARLEC
jgi:hypothetical protein